jgi:hypothetical protein
VKRADLKVGPYDWPYGVEAGPNVKRADLKVGPYD